MTVPREFRRRDFLQITAASLGAVIPFPEATRSSVFHLYKALYEPAPVRVRGQVVVGGSGVGGVGVSDGVDFVETLADGSYEIVTTNRQPFVSLSLPSGFRIPVSEHGTARTFAPIRANGTGEAEASFQLEPLGHDDENHSFLVLADTQTHDREEMGQLHSETVPDVRALLEGKGDTEMFGIACGDIMYDDLALYPEYERAVADMGIPFFQVIGNHDLDLSAQSDVLSTQTFSRHFGPRYYSFDRGAVHYVVLDDVMYNGTSYIGYVDDDQLTWLTADLQRIEAGRTVVVALHIPVVGGRYIRDGLDAPNARVAVTNRQILYRLLEPFNAHVVAGHTHETEHTFGNGVHEYVCGAVCGAWWTGPICGDGTPNGYAVFDVRGEELRWQYKSTGFATDHQITVHRRDADPEMAGHVVANVWDWDPEWSVTWYQDGERKGEMLRQMGFDPESVDLHLGPNLPAKHGWVDPYPTNHMFYAPVNAGSPPITVEATDRFGRVYSGEEPGG